MLLIDISPEWKSYVEMSGTRHPNHNILNFPTSCHMSYPSCIYLHAHCLVGLQELVPAESCAFSCHPRPQSKPQHQHGRKWRRRRREVELLWDSVCGTEVPHWPRLWYQHGWEITHLDIDCIAGLFNIINVMVSWITPVYHCRKVRS